MIVLDTCAFLTQKHPNGEFATVPGIKNEIVNKQSKQYFENMLASNLKIMKAEKSSYEIVQKHAKETDRAGGAVAPLTQKMQNKPIKQEVLWPI